MDILTLQEISYTYKGAGTPRAALDKISLNIRRGDFAAIIGRSGSGKSTLFYIIGCLLRPDSGNILLNGKNVLSLTHSELAKIRNKNIGFVFQQFHLLPRATVLDNILLPALYHPDAERGALNERAHQIAATLGLSDKLGKFPAQLSGGEQQRVVIARALLTEADLILADEPTGNLDSANAEKIFEVLRELNKKGKTVICITHDPEMAKRFHRVLKIQDGKLSENSQAVSVETLETVPLALDSKLSWLQRWKFLKGSLPLAIANLGRNKVRAFLTMLGVVVGIAAVFSMLTFGKFAQDKVMQGYQELGANTVTIQGWSNWRKKAIDKTTVTFNGFDWNKDLLPLFTLFPEVQRISPIMMQWERTTNYGGLSIDNDVRVFGVNEQMLAITGRQLLRGRPFTPYHIQQGSPVCLIGTEIVSRLFKSVLPLGKILFLTERDGSAYSCEVIGILEPQTTNKDWRKPNLEILVPFTYLRQTTKNPWDRDIRQSLLQLHPAADVEKTGKAIRAYFFQKYGKAADFGMGSDVALISQMKKSLTLFTLLLTTIALITLGVGGIGINNMMLVAVNERIKEIGLRKAVGATNQSIRFQFLTESILLTSIAGLIGVILGFVSYELVIWGASKLVAKLPFEWVFEPFPLVLSLVGIVIVGIASGIVPALKAERLQVIEALRAE